LIHLFFLAPIKGLEQIAAYKLLNYVINQELKTRKCRSGWMCHAKLSHEIWPERCERFDFTKETFAALGHVGHAMSRALSGRAAVPCGGCRSDFSELRRLPFKLVWTIGAELSFEQANLAGRLSQHSAVRLRVDAREGQKSARHPRRSRQRSCPSFSPARPPVSAALAACSSSWPQRPPSQPQPCAPACCCRLSSRPRTRWSCPA